MRQLVWIAVFVGFTQAGPMALAQSDSGTKAGAYDAGAGSTPPGYKTDALNPGNCGTPDTPRPCPPLPKHPLQHYRPHPANG